jgi:anti-sigma regulatory factor (Ser/Thr protein kinase)
MSSEPPPESASEIALVLPATTHGLHSCLTSIEEACADWNLPRDTISRLRVVVEELFSNTIKYGYGGESERPVRVRLRGSPPIELVYEDDAPAFDPTAGRDGTPDGALPARDAVGGKGIALALGLTRSARYERLAAGNRLTLWFDRESPSTREPRC